MPGRELIRTMLNAMQVTTDQLFPFGGSGKFTPAEGAGTGVRFTGE